MTTHRPLILGKPEPMPEELLRHVVASLANRDVLNLSAEMGRRLLADRDYHAQRADAAEANYRFMVERATDGGRLDGYRELGQRAADAERERDEARAEVARLRSQIDNTGHTANRSHALELAAALRRETLNGNPPMATTMLLAGELLAADAECRRLRSRVRVEAEDVEAQGLTKAHVDAWLEKSRWACLGPGPVGPVWAFDGQLLASRDGACHIAATIGSIAFHEERSGWDILDEVARMKVTP